MDMFLNVSYHPHTFLLRTNFIDRWWGILDLENSSDNIAGEWSDKGKSQINLGCNYCTYHLIKLY